ncbi:MAG: TadE/TadG family type IV pilus assembly protein [Candidatus Limnocylindrales bacterium]
MERGQALAEFALIVPLFFLIVIAVLDIGRVVWSLDAVSNAAREAARFAIVRGGSVSMGAAATPQAVKDIATSAAVGAGGTPSVTICYGTTQPTVAVAPTNCTVDTNTGSSSYARGTPVTVVVRVNVNLISTGLLGVGSYSVVGSALMMVNN